MLKYASAHSVLYYILCLNIYLLIARDEVIDNFDNMNLREDLLRGIYGYGFEKPSAIQQRAIMPLIKKRDLIAQACCSLRLFSDACTNLIITTGSKWYWQDRHLYHWHPAAC